MYLIFSVCVCVCVLRVTSPGTACQDTALAWSLSHCKASQSWSGFASKMWPTEDCSGITTWAATSPSLNVLKHTRTQAWKDSQIPFYVLNPFLLYLLSCCLCFSQKLVTACFYKTFRKTNHCCWCHVVNMSTLNFGLNSSHLHRAYGWRFQCHVCLLSAPLMCLLPDEVFLR